MFPPERARRRRSTRYRHFLFRPRQVTWRCISPLTLRCLSFALNSPEMLQFSISSVYCRGGTSCSRSKAVFHRCRAESFTAIPAAGGLHVTWPACGGAFDKKMAWARRSGEDNKRTDERRRLRPGAAVQLSSKFNATLEQFNNDFSRHENAIRRYMVILEGNI